MTNEWLTASSFERTFGVISAINTLSIHAKLALAGVADPTEPAEVLQARTTLLAFLDAFHAVLRNAEKDQAGLVVGTDPRLSELALQYRAEQHKLHARSGLFTLPPGELSRLVQSEQAADLPTLVECLESLRGMIDQHGQADVAGIFGEE